MAAVEQWIAIPGWPYEASDQGRIRRSEGGQGAVAGRVLRPATRKDGYLAVVLCRDSVHKTCYVHRLIAFAWLGSCPEEMECNHKDGVKSNNAPDNLQYCTPSENQRHAFETGLQKPCNGEANGCSALNENAVRAIRRLRQEGWLLQKLSVLFGVSPATIGRVCRRELWKHVAGI